MIKQYEIYDDFLEDPMPVVASLRSQEFYYQGKNEITKKIKNNIRLAPENSSDPTSLDDPRYNSPGWKGYRSKSLRIVDERIHNFIMDKIFEKLFDGFYIEKATYDIESYFHILTDEFNVNDNWFHRDKESLIAGVLYLAKYPTPNSGTVLQLPSGRFSIENKFNRLSVYNSNLDHSVEGGFGNSLENGRATFVFFLRSISIDKTIKGDYRK